MKMLVSVHKTMPPIQDVIEVEVDRITCEGRHYSFWMTDEEVKRLQGLRQRGDFDYFMPGIPFMRRSYPQLRIPILNKGDMVRLLPDGDSFRCGRIERSSPACAATAANQAK